MSVPGRQVEEEETRQVNKVDKKIPMTRNKAKEPMTWFSRVLTALFQCLVILHFSISKRFSYISSLTDFITQQRGPGLSSRGEVKKMSVLIRPRHRFWSHHYFSTSEPGTVRSGRCRSEQYRFGAAFSKATKYSTF